MIRVHFRGFQTVWPLLPGSAWKRSVARSIVQQGLTEFTNYETDRFESKTEVHKHWWLCRLQEASPMKLRLDNLAKQSQMHPRGCCMIGLRPSRANMAVRGMPWHMRM
eukprot:1340563-Amphidinium_carterae.1